MNEKYSYLIVKKGPTPASTLADKNEAQDVIEESYFWSRLIRPVIKKQKHQIMDLCTVDGNIERKIVAKSHGTEGGYRVAKKLNWGDLWYLDYRIPNKYRKEKKFGKRLW